MKKSKISSVVKYTVEKNIKNKWFIILNIVFLILSVVALNFNTVKNILKSNNIELDKSKINIVLVDNEKLIIDNLSKNIEMSEYSEKIELSVEEELNYDKDNLDKDKIIVYVESSEENVLNAKVISKEGIDTKYYSIITDAISKSKNDILVSKYGIDDEKLNNILKEPNIERIMTGVESKDADTRYILQTISNYLILLILMIVLSKIANDISQEKISKSIEYVLTSISEKEYLISKVISINLTLIIQLIFAISYFLIASCVNSVLNLFVNTASISLDSNFDTISMLGNIDINMISYVFVIFIFIVLTVFIQCVIQAALSSKTTNITEANNATILLVTLNLIIYMITTFAISPLKEINIIINILSFVPIVSMYFIPALMIGSNISIIHIVLSIIVTIISIPFIFNFCAKIFKNGILDYTSKPKKKKDENDSIEEKESKAIIKKEYSRYGYVIGMSVILFIVCQMVLTVVCAPIISGLSNKIPLTNSELNTILNIIVFVISLVVPTLFIRMYIDKNENKTQNIDKKKLIISVLVAIPIVVFIQIVLGIILEKLGLNYDIVEKTNMYSGGSVFEKILFFIQLAVLPAIFEELYVRGAVLTFSRKYGDKFAIIASAILFSLIHLNISQSIFAFLMGILLAVLVVKTKSIIPSMIIHFLNNGYEALYLILEGNTMAIGVLNIVFLILSIVGVALIVYLVVKNRSTLLKKKNNGVPKVSFNKSVLYIFSDYSFIVSVILVCLMMVLTQKMLMIM